MKQREKIQLQQQLRRQVCLVRTILVWWLSGWMKVRMQNARSTMTALNRCFANHTVMTSYACTIEDRTGHLPVVKYI